MLLVNGLLLYVTCSVFPEEGEDQAIWFAQQQGNAVRLDAPGQILPSQANDGFTMPCLRKMGHEPKN